MERRKREERGGRKNHVTYRMGEATKMGEM
jgi:hypothetical protein